MAEPVAETRSCDELPDVIVDGVAVGWAVMPGDVQPPVTVTVAVLLSKWPQLFETRTQYVVVLTGDTVGVADVAPPTGVETSPVLPMYH